MNYTLSLGTLNSPIVEITKQEFEEILLSNDQIFDLISSEERYDLVIENYLEFERTLFDSAFRGVISFGFFPEWLNRERNAIDRRIFNLLSSCRAFMEFASHIVAASERGSQKLKELRAALYDNHFSYRLMEALRNFVTYRGFAVHFLKYSSERQGVSEDKVRFRFGVPELVLAAEYLEKSKKFPKKCLNEIRERDGKVSFVPLLREYISDLSHVNEFVREITKIRLMLCRETIVDILQRIPPIDSESEEFHSICVIARNGNELTNEFYVSGQPLKRIDWFRKKNRRLPNLHLSYVTSEIKSE